MAVYVDDMYLSPMGAFRTMKMSHMIADTHEELMQMADRLGVRRKWLQQPGNAGEHFDIALSKRTLAVAMGAHEVSMHVLAMKCQERRGSPSGERAYFGTCWRRA